MKKSSVAIIVLACICVVAVAVFGVVAFMSANEDKSDKKDRKSKKTHTTETIEINEEATYAEAMSVIFGEEVTLNTQETVTQAAAEQGDYLSTLNDEEIELLNIFLSNFSEAYVSDIDTTDQKKMLDFILLNTDINYNDNIQEDETGIADPDGEENWLRFYLTEEYVKSRMDRFFGVELVNQSSDYLHYINGRYYIDIGAGDHYTDFTKVTKAARNADGTITVDYDVYYYDFEAPVRLPDRYKGIGAENVDSTWCKYEYSGTAVLSEANFGEGYANYRLISMHKK